MHGQDPNLPSQKHPPPQHYDPVAGRHASPMNTRPQQYISQTHKMDAGNGAQYYEPYGGPPPPPSGQYTFRRPVMYEYLDKVREELKGLEMKVEQLTVEKGDLVQYYDLYHKANAEVERYIDVNNRYQAIINQLLPMLPASVQDGVRQDMDSIKKLTFIVPIPAQPPIAPNIPDQNLPPRPPVAVAPAPPPPMPYNGAEMERKARARPAPVMPQQQGPGPTKRTKVDDGGAGFGHPVDNFEPEPTYGYTAPIPPAPTRAPVPKGANLLATLNHKEVVCSFAMTNPMSHIFTGGKGAVKIWDVSQAREGVGVPQVGTIDCLESYIRATKMTNDGQRLIVSGEVGYMVICDVASPAPRVIGRIDTPNLLTYALAVSNDSKYLFSCHSEGTINMWDIHQRRLVRSLGHHNATATCCALTTDGQRVISGSLDKTVRVWDIIAGKEVLELECPSPIYSLAHCPVQPPRIAVGLDKSLEIRRMSEMVDNRRELTGVHQDCVLSVKYSPNGNWLASAGKDKKLVCWRTSDFSSIFEMSEASSILCTEISNCGDYMATGTGDAIANLYSMIY